MKPNYIILYCFLVFLTCCESLVEEDVYSDLTEANFLSTQSGINSVLNQAYVEAQHPAQTYEQRINESVINSGIAYGIGGSFEGNVGVPFRDFTWTSTYGNLGDRWNVYYRGIRNTNIVIDNILDNESLSPEFKIQSTAEAKALRGYFYSRLYTDWGPVPILTSSREKEFEKPRSSDQEMMERIEQDLVESADVLPISQNQSGKYTKGTALAILCRHYMYTKQWQKAAESAKEIMNLNKYSLVPDYADIYSHENEQNSEGILVIPHIAGFNVGNITAMMTPPDVPLLPNQGNFAMRLLIYDEFIDSFDELDSRKNLIVKQYVNRSGELVQAYGNNLSYNNKYPPDPNGIGFSNGIDMIEIRYAGILLYLAEALNELTGPTQEAIDLINEVRARAKAPLVSLGDFDKATLRDHILKERQWELYFETGEREDLIRHDLFISNALKRGVSAADEHHVLYPIPQEEVDTNTKLEQNEGY